MIARLAFALQLIRIAPKRAEALGLKTPLLFVEAHAVHATPAASLGDVAEFASGLQHAHVPLRDPAGCIPW